ncbi:MAG: autotransporter-associated beta strand repeat-containing protein [Methylococcaceae bacterium]
MKTLLKHSGLLAAAGLLLSPIAQASSFTISSNSTTAQTLGTGAGQTGAVNIGNTLSVSGGTDVVTISGNSATLNNLGSIRQTGTGRVIRDNTGVTGLTITNGSLSNSTALMQSADADVFQMNKANASVTLNNYGSMISLNASAGGAQAVDFNAITNGANIINNFSTGIMQAAEADAVRPGVNGVVNNAGTIKATTTTGSSSDGVDVQADKGVIINNAFIAGAGTGSGLIEAARHGITGGPTGNTAFTTTVNNYVGGIIKGNNGSGINLDGLSALQTATIVNNGTITGNGVTGDGDGIDVDGVVNITNTGIIRSINAFSSTATPAQSEGITVGGGTITNSGTIEGLIASGNNNAVGRGITLAGVDTSGTPEHIYANSIITNQSGALIKGQSDSAILVGGAASGFTVTVNNNASAILKGGGAVNAAIKTGADNDTITNAGIINGSSSGKAIDLGAGINTLTVQGGAASILGDVSGGTGSSTLNLNIGSGNGFNYAGALSNFNSVQVNSGTTTLSGASSYTGPTTINSGALMVSNSIGSATGSSAVEVKSSTSFGGTGSITGALTVDEGGILSPGLGGVGTLALGSTVLSQNSIFTVDLNPFTGTADRVNVTGLVSLNLSNLTINLLYAPTFGQTFNLLNNDGSDAITGIFNQGSIVSAMFGGQSWDFKIDYAYNADGGVNGNDILLTAVPVPAAAWLFGTGFLGFFGAARKRKAA